MQLEAVGGVSVGKLGLEVGGKVDNGDGTKGTLLRTDTATNTEGLRDIGDSRLGGDLDTELAALDNRAGFLAFLTTFLQHRAVSKPERGCAYIYIQRKMVVITNLWLALLEGEHRELSVMSSFPVTLSTGDGGW